MRSDGFLRGLAGGGQAGSLPFDPVVFKAKLTEECCFTTGVRLVNEMDCLKSVPLH